MNFSAWKLIGGRKTLFVITVRRFESSNVRVRFAPSPTGYLHLGGLRTALYNFLFTKLHHGKFILRIEDTDQTRLVKGATEQLQNDLIWSGIEIDEGPNVGGNFGPYLQSKRLNIYKENVKVLLENGSAYHCFCTDKRLELLRKEAIRAHEIPKYDNRCRHLTSDEVKKKLESGLRSCIRFKMHSNEETFDDLIYGKISYDVAMNEGDPVIIKSDGFPTYHFANVVDDHLMEISHVFRGVEWQISTTKHLLLYRAFNWNPPVFGHLPLLMNADGTKLSKRQGDIHISNYRDKSIFPLALLNYIVHCGGGFSKDLIKNCKPKCFTIAELTEQFDITKINTHSGKLMPEWLLEYNRLELKRRLADKTEETVLINQLREMVQSNFPQHNTLDNNYLKYILHWSANRIEKLSDLVSNKFEFVWKSPNEFKINFEDTNIIISFSQCFERENDLDREKLNLFLRKFAKENSLKFGSFMKMLRSVLSGLQEGPSVAEIIEILGKDNTLNRLNFCIKHNKSDVR